jgi:Protein of unknown function (DUF3307)
VPWVEVFSVFLVCHLVGDYLLQTDWQAANKRGGLGPNRESRRALLSHITTYTLAFVPALIWLLDEIDAWVIGVAALIALPHMVQDDGRLLERYIAFIKGEPATRNAAVVAVVDQSFHIVVLFLIALLAGS